MNYIDEIFERCNIDGISNYLLHGGETIENQQDSYYERAKITEKKLINWLNEQFPDYECHYKQSSFIYSVISEMQSIYMQIGLQAGIMLTTEFFQKSKTD